MKLRPISARFSRHARNKVKGLRQIRADVGNHCDDLTRQRIYEALHLAYGPIDSFQWLNTPNPLLRNLTPLAALDEGLADEVEKAVKSIDCGVWCDD